MKKKVLLGLAGLVLLAGLWVTVQIVFARPHGDCVTKAGDVPGTMQGICP